MADLLIRAGMNDHLVIGDLLAPTGGRLGQRRPTFSRLVADAHVATARQVLGDLARDAGVPFLVDPDTTLMQTEVSATDRWAHLPFAAQEPVRPGDVSAASLVAKVVEFQLDSGATTIIPPYFYASSPNDPWFLLSLQLLDETVKYLSQGGIKLPLLPVLCAQLQSFGSDESWELGIRRFLHRVKGCGADSVALFLSPSGAGTDGYGKLTRLFETALRAKQEGLRVIAWRQGVYGPALVAAGIDGYETGIGTGEQTHVVRRQSSRKPREGGSSGGGGAGIFIETLGRSVPRRVGQVLLGNVAMRPKVMCDDESCCPTVAATLDSSRHHAVRTRARNLAELIKQPHRQWRLTHMSRLATSAAILAGQANKVLAAEDCKERIRSRNLDALAQITADLAASDVRDGGTVDRRA